MKKIKCNCKYKNEHYFEERKKKSVEKSNPNTNIACKLNPTTKEKLINKPIYKHLLHNTINTPHTTKLPKCKEILYFHQSISPIYRIRRA